MNLYSTTLLALITVAFFSEQSFSSTHGDDLANWSIPIKSTSFKSAIEPSSQSRSSNSKHDEYDCSVSSPTGYLYLTQPNSSKVVAVLEINQALPPVLNPKGFDYGPIPALRDINKMSAEILWGKEQKAKKENETTYRLKSKDDCDYFLDVSFNHNKMDKYKVRSAQLRGSDIWRSVEKSDARLNTWSIPKTTSLPEPLPVRTGPF